MQALRIAATGMNAQQLNVDVLSNNIANLNTTGFKQGQAAFSDLIYQNRIGVGAITSSAGTLAPTGLQIGLGVNIGSVYRIMQQGAINQTSNPLDLAMSGRGFFRVTMPDGSTSYTRDGSFQLNQDGQLVTKDGFTVDPAITVPTNATDFTVTNLGIVSAKVDGVVTELGTITVSMFVNEAGLESLGDNYYRETEASGAAADVNPSEDGAGTIRQGALESSNVDAIESITRLITAQRAYELNSKIITAADQMLSTLTQMT
ncbi:MAG: flagellar basal-body rod protein FlgG [Alphaproteobacteria bacterium]|nr:MAG: flagellar basal-body rod protein FlgG [Alphaproteobacteria bacterium]